MANGKQRKIQNERVNFIKHELQQRFNEVRSQEQYNKGTKESIEAAVKRLTANVRYSESLTIPFEEYSGSNPRYKNAMPKGYTKLLKSLKERLQELITLCSSEQTDQHDTSPVHKESAHEEVSSQIPR